MPLDKIFEAQPGLVLLLSPALIIQGATDAYLRETLTIRENIIGRHLFDVFPDNPDTPEPRASIRVQLSIAQVLATGKSHKLENLQYDIPDPNKAGSFIERYWSAINTAVLNEKGEIVCIVHEAVNISGEVKARDQLKQSQEREHTALAQAEQQRLRLERLFDQAPAAFALLEGPTFIFKVVNNAYQQLFPGRELLGLPLFEALSELREQSIYQIIHNVYSTGETFEGKNVLVPLARYEGLPMEDIYWNFIYQALYDAQGQINGILIFALDVTEFVVARRLVEQNAAFLLGLNRELEDRVALRTRELQLAQAEAERQSKRLNSLFMQAPAAICILDGPELAFELVNPDYEQLFPGRKLLGKPILEVLPEIKDNLVYKTFREVYDTGNTHEEAELLIPIARPADGVLEERFFRFIQQARFNENGMVDGIVVFALEVTEQVGARRAVEASARQLQLITDSLPVLISYLDKEEKYQFVNLAYEGWFKLKVADMLNKTVMEVVGEQAYDQVKGYLKRALAGERLDYEAAMPYRAGFKHTRASFVPDISNGEVVGVYALVTDVTNQALARLALEQQEQEAKAMAQELAMANEGYRLLNMELAVANQQLTHTNTDLDNFIYTASHDLKAPISNIEMLVEELVDVLPPESIRQEGVEDIIAMIKDAISRFTKTIANLTEISKLQKDNIGLVEVVCIEEIIKEVRLDLKPIITRSGTRIELELNGCSSVSFSEKNLRSIVYNLLSNSIKYRHPERVPVVTISCREETGYLVLQVRDNGLGLSEVQLGKLFSMFRRFHDHVEGSGIGLFMVKRIIDNAGGKIEVESEIGTGTAFSIYIRK